MATLRITVSELKCAALDPDWRGQWLAGGRPSTMGLERGRKKAGSFDHDYDYEHEHEHESGHGNKVGKRRVMGAEFHKLAEEFTQWVTGPGSREAAARLAGGTELWQALYDRVAGDRLAQWLGGGKGAAVPRLVECLKAFCGRLAGLRQRQGEAFRDWRDVFLVEEFSLGEVEIPVGTAHRLVVCGRVDAVRIGPEGVVEIVDYKLSGGETGPRDFAQLAIYAHLLARRNPGLAVRGVLEYYSPELKEVTLEREALEEVYRQVVEPVLPLLFECGMRNAECGMKETGQQATNNGQPTTSADFIPHSAFHIPHSATDAAGVIRQVFADFHLAVEIAGEIDAPQLRRILVRPATGVKVVSLANRAEDLQVRLGLALPPLVRPTREGVAIDIPKERPDGVPWRRVAEDQAFRGKTSPVCFAVGLGVEGRLILADLADPVTCHVLVGGGSGSGKSEFLKCLVAALMTRATPEELRLTLIDPKILTFRALEGSPYLEGGVASGVGEAIRRLAAAVDEMDRRYRRLKDEGVANLAERFGRGRRDLPFHVIVFDEFADLVLAGREEKKEFEALACRLAQKGRAAGIHLVLATQRPDRTVVSGLIKSNLPLKVCLKVTTEANSRIILDESGGQALFGRGDLLCDLGQGRVERAQSPRISAEELARVGRVARVG